MKPGAAWPVGIALVLAASVAGNLAMLRVAGDDPSMAIEPDYYRKAVGFDSTMARERRSNALGWHAITTLDSVVDGTPTTVRVQLSDSTNTPIGNATVSIVALFNARANEVQALTLEHEPNGSYRGSLVIRHAGEWEVRVDAVRGAAHFVGTSRVIAVGASVAAAPRPGSRP